MILSQLFTSEIADCAKSVEESNISGENDLNENTCGVIHHDIIEAIHKQILVKCHQIGFFNINEGFTFEGIIHLDCRESHYRVKTEILGSIGPVFAVKICTITHSVPVAIAEKDRFKSSIPTFIADERLSNKSNINISNQYLNLDVSESRNSKEMFLESMNDVDKTPSPIDYSSKLSNFDKNEAFLTQIKESNNLELLKSNVSMSKSEEIFRGPLNYSTCGTSGLGFVLQKKRGSDVLNLYLCPLCVYCCVKRGELKKHHTAVHLNGKPYGCPHCPYRSTHKSTLRSHIMSRHTGERPFECSQCDYKASQKGLVDKHIMTKHTGEKPFKCPHCDFSSSHSSTVKTHIMFKHTGEKPFECPHCEYRAVQRGHIVRHIKSVHSGEKPFKCPHCEYKACRNTNIKKHVMAVHCKEKPHHCPHCDFKSSHKGNLNSHLISKHTEMKPFACQFCSYKSSCKTGLNKHLLKHKTGKKIKFSCHYCTYSSDRKDHLRTHVIFVHFKGDRTLHKNTIKGFIKSELTLSADNDVTNEKMNSKELETFRQNTNYFSLKENILDTPSTSNPD